MARDLVIIGCKLPNGLTLTHPVSKEQVTVAGMHASKVIGSTHMNTPVDAEFWAAWKTAYSDYAPLKNGSIFEARNETEALAKSKELRKEKTGFEPMAQDAAGVKKADSK
jgi:hypothetical protein